MTKERQFRTRYTIDSKGRIRAYYGYDAWEHLRRSDERQVRVKDLPRGFEVYEELDDYDAYRPSIPKLDVRDITPEQAVEATLGRGECRIETVTTDARDWPNNERCTSCGEFVSVINPMPPRFCPNCGRKVVGE